MPALHVRWSFVYACVERLNACWIILSRRSPSSLGSVALFSATFAPVRKTERFRRARLADLCRPVCANDLPAIDGHLACVSLWQLLARFDRDSPSAGSGSFDEELPPAAECFYGLASPRAAIPLGHQLHSKSSPVVGWQNVGQPRSRQYSMTPRFRTIFLNCSVLRKSA